MTPAPEHALPAAGGSYIRQKDGSLRRASDPVAAPAAPVAPAADPAPEVPAADANPSPSKEA